MYTSYEISFVSAQNLKMYIYISICYDNIEDRIFLSNGEDLRQDPPWILLKLNILSRFEIFIYSILFSMFKLINSTVFTTRVYHLSIFFFIFFYEKQHF